jgi:hypothetical protein
VWRAWLGVVLAPAAPTKSGINTEDEAARCTHKDQNVTEPPRDGRLGRSGVVGSHSSQTRFGALVACLAGLSPSCGTLRPMEAGQ